MAGGEAAEPPPPPAATKRRRLLRRGAAGNCPSAMGSEVEVVPISGDESGERPAANHAFDLFVNMASHGNYLDDSVSSTGQSSPTKYQSTSHSPSAPSLASQGSTSQLPPPQRPNILTPPLSMTASTSSSTDAGPARKGRGHRGLARGLAIRGLQEGQFLEVQIQGGTGVGDHGSKFVSQLGIIARTHCKIWQSNWSKLPSETKEAIFKDLQLKFRFERTHAAEKEIIQHMGEMHRKYRGALKKRFFSGKSFEEAVANVPLGVDPADWRVMCEKWSTSAEQSVANRNMSNRAHQTMPCRLGRQNIYQVKEEFRKTQGRDPDRTEIFRLTRSKKLPDGNQAWVDDESREKMDQITQLMEQPSERGGEILTSEQAFVRVMGNDRPGRVRCAGRAVTLRKWYGPSEGSASSSSYQNLLEQNQAQAQKIKEQAEDILRLKKNLQEDRQQQQKQMCEMQEMQMQMQMQQQMQEMLTCFWSSQVSKTSLVGSNERYSVETGKNKSGKSRTRFVGSSCPVGGSETRPREVEEIRRCSLRRRRYELLLRALLLRPRSCEPFRAHRAMAADGEKPKLAACGKTKKRKYLPHGKPVRKGPYPLHPGVQGFFITCDGGRERQAANDAVNILENFYEELLGSKDSGTKSNVIPSKPLNKITKFHDSDSSDGEEESDVENGKAEEPGESEETPSKKQRLETDAACEQSVSNAEEKTIDALIEDELEELGDRKKRHFVSLDSGCNGCIFIQMNKRDGDPTPSSIVQHMMTSAASSRKHMSRFILRVLPAEVACYASVEEIMKAIEPLMSHYFPTEATSPQKFAVLYEARANTGIDRMKIIDAVAKSVPQPHKVDLSNPDKTIIVQIVKTICLLSVVERYKELSKYNLRQLTTTQKK